MQEVPCADSENLFPKVSHAILLEHMQWFLQHLLLTEIIAACHSAQILEYPYHLSSVNRSFKNVLMFNILKNDHIMFIICDRKWISSSSNLLWITTQGLIWGSRRSCCWTVHPLTLTQEQIIIILTASFVQNMLHSCSYLYILNSFPIFHLHILLVMHSLIQCNKDPTRASVRGRGGEGEQQGAPC